MTVCVPMRPFIVTGKIIVNVLCFLPPIMIIFGIYEYFTGVGMKDVTFILMGGVTIMFTIARLTMLNSKYRWVEWCKDKKEIKN